MSGPGPQPLSTRQAWFGPAYMSMLCAQSGYSWTPVPADNDVASFDGNVTVAPGLALPVQIKCRRKAFPVSCSYAIEPAWRSNWNFLPLPSFFVVVVVPETVGTWMEHDVVDGRTVLNSSAYWTRIDPLAPDQASIQVQHAYRMTADTIELWRVMAEETMENLRGYGLEVSA